MQFEINKDKKVDSLLDFAFGICFFFIFFFEGVMGRIFTVEEE